MRLIRQRNFINERVEETLMMQMKCLSQPRICTEMKVVREKMIS